MTGKILATTLLTLGIILPASVTFIFKNGCRQDNSNTWSQSRTNEIRDSAQDRERTAKGQSTDISTLPLQAKETPQRK